MNLLRFIFERKKERKKESTMCVSRIMIMKHHKSVQNRETDNTENSPAHPCLLNYTEMTLI